MVAAAASAVVAVAVRVVAVRVVAARAAGAGAADSAVPARAAAAAVRVVVGRAAAAVAESPVVASRAAVAVAESPVVASRAAVAVAAAESLAVASRAAAAAVAESLVVAAEWAEAVARAGTANESAQAFSEGVLRDALFFLPSCSRASRSADNFARMSLTVRVLIGLVAGLIVGFAANASPDLRAVIPWIEPLGSIFINAIRMTVVPLVVASLVVGVAGATDARAIGRVGWRALVLFVIIVLAGSVFGAIVAQPILTRMIDPALTTASALSTGNTGELVGAAREGAQRLPTFAQWLIDLVPSNPIRAAADGAMLPLIVFSLLFGVALLQLDADRRRPVIGFFEGVADAMLVLVRWVLALAPIGVFALAVPLAARMGFAAAGALLGFIILVSGLSVAFMALVLYPAASLIGRVPLGTFARAIAPSQAVAFSSRSSLAALPAMIRPPSCGSAFRRRSHAFSSRCRRRHSVLGPVSG